MPEEYYDVENVYSALTHNEALYYRSLQHVLGDPPVLGDPEKPITAVLGGFNPRSGIDIKFNEFVGLIHPHSQNHNILLDMQKRPFEMLSKPEELEYKLMADLTKLPLKAGSVDIMILDYTTHFMKDQDLEKMGSELERVLKNEGIALLVQEAPVFSFINRFFKSRANKTQVYVRSEAKSSKLLNPLKTIFIVESETKEIIMGFARSDSKYQPFDGQPYYFDMNRLFESGKAMKERRAE